jgi:NAD(P)-dependent dehydrogenase (short-subunit alcohol dehydrogenase family)
VVVTGASRGIGRATALLAARRGERVALVGRESDAMHEVTDECRRLGTEVTFVACDLADTQQIDAAAERIVDLGTPKALINNAAIIERAPLTALSLDSFRRQLDTNLVAPVWLTRALVASMVAARHGRIVNVGSISGVLGTAHQVAYNASKWALIGFTKSLARELTDSGVSVVTVLPGGVATDMTRESPFPPRMSADDVARVLLYYALDASVAHNGANIEMFAD